MADRGQVKRIMKAARFETAKSMRQAVFAVIKELGEATPVKTGYARGNWQVGIGSAPATEVGLRNLTSMLASAAGRLAQLKKPQPVFIANNVEYIGKLNAGSSRKAPSGFVEAAIARGIAKAQK